MCYGYDDDYEGYSWGRDEYNQEYEDMLLQRHIDEHTEEEAFKKVPKHGYDSPAYKREIRPAPLFNRLMRSKNASGGYAFGA